MATTKNKNLFYLLYSKDKSVANSGYACSLTVDESLTSFDISGSEALITDSNGDVLASLDLSTIHEGNITQYNVETKILQPKSAYLLLGNEYGETYKQLFFIIPELISKLEEYDEYCNIKFDITYKLKNKICCIHIETETIRETYDSFTILVLSLLNKLKIPVSISIKLIDDPDSSDKKIQYVNFLGTEEGYDFVVRNVILVPILCDALNCNGEIGEFYDSPFKPVEITNDYIIELINKHKPLLIGLNISNIQYKINCDIYRALMYLSNDITSDFNLFVYELDILKEHFLPCFETDGTLIFTKKFNDIVIKRFPEIYNRYFSKPLNQYNIYDIVKMLEEIKDYIFTLKNSLGPNNCYEDLNKRINNVKYPNGALRGIVVLPIWPSDSDFDYCTLWANHVADKIEICVPVEIEMLNKYFGGNIVSNRKTTLFEKSLATVKVNALLPSEKEQYIEDTNNLPLNDITSNDGFTNSVDNMYKAAYDNYNHINNGFYRQPVSLLKHMDNDPIKYYDPDMYINVNNDNEDIWENNPNKTNTLFVDSHEEHVMNTVGLYKYMEYLSNNDLWLKIGNGYMSIAKDDNLQSKDRNLLQSMLIYNPNDEPIKIKYIIFS